MLAGVWVLPRGVVRNLNLLGRLNVALGLQHLLSGGRVPRGGVAGGGNGLPRGCHDESCLLRVLGDEG